MSYLEELLPEFRKGAKIRLTEWEDNLYIYFKNGTIYGEDNKPLKYLLNDIYGWFYNPRWELYRDLLTGTTSSRTSAYAGFGMITLIMSYA